MPRVIEALLSFTVALELYAKELEKQTNASHSSSTANVETKDEMEVYLDRRRHEESEAIGEIVGPLLTGAYSSACHAKLPVRESNDLNRQMNFIWELVTLGCMHQCRPRDMTALRSGVKLIAGAFGERLEVFKFSPETAERLQAVVDQR